MKTLGRKTTKTEKTTAPKTSKAKAATAATAAGRKRTPTHEEIAVRSYELYLERGREEGHAEEDWLRAESELTN
jgi:hypothetical protein